MLNNAFIGKADPPSDDDLTAELAAAKPLWDELLKVLSSEFALTGEWHSYSRKAGWALRFKRDRRNIIYLSPGRGGFFVSFVLGQKALVAARASRLPARVLKVLDEARRYAEGTAVRLDIGKASDIDAARKLAAAKLAN